MSKIVADKLKKLLIKLEDPEALKIFVSNYERFKADLKTNQKSKDDKTRIL